MGYERGTTISKAWEQATTDGAIETGRPTWLSHLRELAEVREETQRPGERSCGSFAASLPSGRFGGR